MSSVTERDVRGAMRYWQRGYMERKLNDRDDQSHGPFGVVDENAHGQHMNDISKKRGALKGDAVEPSLDGNNRAPKSAHTQRGVQVQ